MNRNILRIILIILGVVIILLGVGYYIFKSGTPSEQTGPISEDAAGSLPIADSVVSGGNPNNEPAIGGITISNPNFATSVIVEDLKKRSIIAIERLGSYSSDRPLSNFDDVLPYTTASLEVVLRDTREQIENRFTEGNGYEGYSVIAVTTDAESVNIEAGRIVIKINAIREVSIGSQPTTQNNTVYSLTWDYGEDTNWHLSGISGDF